MLHITKKTKSTHKKAVAAEIFVSLAMLAVFFSTAAQASDITGDMVIKLVNKARAVTNVAILKKNSLLQEAAEKKAQDMIDNDYFAHVSPQGKSPWYWIQQNGYDYRFAGENLAINFTNAEEQQKAWMDSPLHKKNILNPEYREIGVAVKQGKINGQMTTVVVQMFGTEMQGTETLASASQQDVAGVQSDKTANAEVVSSTIPSRFDLKMFFDKYNGTLNGWMTALVFAMLLIISDIAVVILRRNAHLIGTHRAGNHTA